MNILGYILWDVSPSIVNFFGREIRWYGLLWALSFIAGSYLMTWMYENAGRNKKEIDSLTIYMMLATVLGARLGHCIFYDWDLYKDNLISILYVWEGGLASHGAGLGILTGVYLYTRKFKVDLLWLFDRIAIGVALAGALIRIGNYMNSEIIGKASDANTSVAFVLNAERRLMNVNYRLENQNQKIQSIDFEKISGDTLVNDFNYPKVKLKLNFSKNAFPSKETASMFVKSKILTRLYQIEKQQSIKEHHVVLLNTIPKIDYETNGLETIVSFNAFLVTRHPAQMYEAISCLLLFLVLLGIYYKLKENTPKGILCGIFFVVVFSLRFVWETMKEVQVDFERDMSLNMGQWLSIPFITIGVILLINSLLEKKWLKI